MCGKNFWSPEKKTLNDCKGKIKKIELFMFIDGINNFVRNIKIRKINFSKMWKKNKKERRKKSSLSSGCVCPEPDIQVNILLIIFSYIYFIQVCCLICP